MSDYDPTKALKDAMGGALPTITIATFFLIIASLQDDVYVRKFATFGASIFAFIGVLQISFVASKNFRELEEHAPRIPFVQGFIFFIISYVIPVLAFALMLIMSIMLFRLA